MTKARSQTTKLTPTIARLVASFFFLWLCAQVYFLSVTGQEGKATGEENESYQRRLDVELALNKEINDAVAANLVTGVNEGGVLDARKKLLEYFLRTDESDKAEMEARRCRDDAMKATSISFEDKISTLAELAGMMRDGGKFQFSEELYEQLLAELRKHSAPQPSPHDLLKQAIQLNNFSLTYFLWSQASPKPIDRRKLLDKAMVQSAKCDEVLSKINTTAENRIEKENVITTYKNNQKIFQSEATYVTYGSP